MFLRFLLAMVPVAFKWSDVGSWGSLDEVAAKDKAGNVIGGRVGAIRMPRDGRLYLGVNDDHLPDNKGEFRVTMTFPR